MPSAGTTPLSGASPALVLASGSSQRRAILARLGVAFTVRPMDVDELDRGDPAEVAVENALRKARAARACGLTGSDRAEDVRDARSLAGSDRAEATTGPAGSGETVLGCDTLVVLDGAIYGKPADESAARATLRALSGDTHEVLSGLALLTADGEERTALARTKVIFRAYGETLLDWYVATGEWHGRAGGYAIQGAGAVLVRAVEGDYENVVGLPLATLLDLYPALLGSL